MKIGHFVSICEWEFKVTKNSQLISTCFVRKPHNIHNFILHEVVTSLFFTAISKTKRGRWVTGMRAGPSELGGQGGRGAFIYSPLVYFVSISLKNHSNNQNQLQAVELTRFPQIFLPSDGAWGVFALGGLEAVRAAGVMTPIGPIVGLYGIRYSTYCVWRE